MLKEHNSVSQKVELKPEDSENHLQVATAAFVLEDYSLFENH